MKNAEFAKVAAEKLAPLETEELQTWTELLMNDYRDGVDMLVGAILDELEKRMDAMEFATYCDNISIGYKQ